MKSKILMLILAIAVCQAAGVIGAFFTFTAIPVWFVTLTKPSFAPPNYVFGPVWTILYTLMGVSLFLVWQRGLNKEAIKQAVIIFFVHLVFNSLWSIIFFGLRNPGLAFIEIVVLWGLIVLTIKKFWQIDHPAAYLLIPYLLWVTFASFLNFAIWRLNP